MRPAFRGVFRLLARVKVTGLENVPPKGAYLIAFNHVSLFDPAFMAAFWPVAPEAVGASDLWERRGQALLVRLYGGIPVHRGRFDRRVIDAVLAALASGCPLLIAPEGTRSHRPGMQRAKPGVAYLMDEARISVVPVGVVGTTEDLWSNSLRGERPLIEMRIGRPLQLPPLQGKGAARRAARQQDADLVMAHIAALVPPDYRGAYSGCEDPGRSLGRSGAA